MYLPKTKGLSLDLEDLALSEQKPEMKYLDNAELDFLHGLVDKYRDYYPLSSWASGMAKQGILRNFRRSFYELKKYGRKRFFKLLECEVDWLNERGYVTKEEVEQFQRLYEKIKNKNLVMK